MPLAAIAHGRRIPDALVITAIVLGMLLAGALLPPLPEPQVFRGLADTRALLGIPNFMNVISNAPFLLVGLWGLYFVARHGAHGQTFADPRERWPYFICFLAVTLVFFGSSYYHLDIDPAGLFWDRLPMAVGFAAILAAVIVERLDARLGLRMLIPLVLIGAASVLYWRWSLLYGTENLVPYAIVQYGSIAAVLVLCAAFPSRYTRGADAVHAIGFYALAKVAEVLDQRIYALGEIISGHTLKHLIAAFAVYWLLRMLRLRLPR